MKVLLCLVIFCSLFSLKRLFGSNDENLFGKKSKFFQLIIALCVQSKKNISDTEKKQIIRFHRKLIEFEFELLDEFKRNGDAFDLVNDPEKRKKLARIVYRYAKTHEEITDFTKNIIKILAKIFISLTNAEMRSSHFENFQSADISFEELAIMFEEYIPKDVDILQAFMEHAVWAHKYLYKRLSIKKFFMRYIACQNYLFVQDKSIDSGCYVMQELGRYLKLPKKSQKIWNEFAVLVHEGIKTLSDDMRRSIIEDGESKIQSKVVGDFINSIGSVAKLRKSAAQDVKFYLNHSLEKDDDIDDEFWDKVVESLFLLIKINSPVVNDDSKENKFSNYFILEKMIFKN